MDSHKPNYTSDTSRPNDNDDVNRSSPPPAGTDSGARRAEDGRRQDDNRDNDDGARGGDDDGGNQRKRPGKKPLIILAIVVVVMLIAGLWFWLSSRNQETTDDAYTEGNAVTIAPKISGYVVKLLIKDNQRVRKGDLLVQIDPRDATAARVRSWVWRRRSWRCQRCNIPPNWPRPKHSRPVPNWPTPKRRSRWPPRCSCRCVRSRPTSKRANARSVKRRHNWKPPN